MLNHNQTLGKNGEELVYEDLLETGHEILDMNARTPFGEIDIIARKDDKIVFVEVKTRQYKKYGDGTEAITHTKSRHISNSARYWIQESNWDGDVEIRAATVDFRRGHRPNITWLRML